MPTLATSSSDFRSAAVHSERMRTLVFLFVLGLAVPASAQTNPVPVSQPFDVGWQHTGDGTPTFQCEVDGTPVGGQLSSAARRCTIPGQSAGTHTVTVTASNAFGSATSAPLPATAGSPPSAPTNLQIVVQVAVQPDGRVTLLAASVAKQ